MGKNFVDRLSAGEILVADGATATNYQQIGMTIGVAPEEWVFDRPDKVLGLHRAFIAAGSDIILTDTFGATSPRLRDSKYAGRTTDLNRRAVALAREAASIRPGVLVAGSMGPTGMLMEPFGELTPAAATDAYAEQAAALRDGGADLLLLETFFALEEALAAIEGVQRASALPLVVSFSFDQGTRTMMGVSPARVVEAIAPLGVAAIGANCGRSLEDMERVVHELAALNAGIRSGSSQTRVCRAWLATSPATTWDPPRWRSMRGASSTRAPGSSAAAAAVLRSTWPRSPPSRGRGRAGRFDGRG
jgi:5-methyltetrahydrofolate--homocysteine methyltransferase